MLKLTLLCGSSVNLKRILISIYTKRGDNNEEVLNSSLKLLHPGTFVLHCVRT